MFMWRRGRTARGLAAPVPSRERRTGAVYGDYARQGVIVCDGDAQSFALGQRFFLSSPVH